VRSPNPRSAAPNSVLGYVPELDGLRGVAILLVLASHTPLSAVVPFGGSGVDLFFVLSGYLITSILLKSKGSPAYVRNFYIRRGLRIWPLYAVLLVFCYAIAARFIPALGFAPDSYPWYWYALYLQNFAIRDPGPIELSVTWSLAIEEQFYLVWPWVVRRLSARQLTLLLIGMVVAAPVCRAIAAYALGLPQRFAYALTFCRMDAIAAGALIATLKEAWPTSRADVEAVASRAVVLLPLAWGLSYFPAFRSSSLTFVVMNSLTPIGYAGLLSVVLSNHFGRLNRWLSASALRYTGKISYGLYIYHMIVFTLLHAYFRPWLGSIVSWPTSAILVTKWLVALPAIAVIASVSWILFERPILGLKARFGEAALAEHDAVADAQG
jgi:peptidoglycan/LPS O-acetylase OafA/YrhL